ncbi:MAG TPA: hypothetical protein VIU85_09920 [Chthoniobacterales bacterium]
MRLKHLLLPAALILAVGQINATTVIPPTFDELVKQAEFIFQGTVTDVRSAWEGQGGERHIETYVTFQVADNVKGDAGASYTIRMLGGTVGDETMLVTDTPKFRVGDNEILFVEHNFDQFVPLVGISHGRFHVQRDEETGRDVVISGEGEAVGDLSKLGREEQSAGAAGAMSPEQFKSAIKNQLQAGHPAQ